ncbi:MAG TPA: ATP-binding protein [Longimicrobiales bacterium]|nr:ATP-binding protein [Longimicrobiales bacterium]
MSSITPGEASRPADGRVDGVGGSGELLRQVGQVASRALRAPTAILSLLRDGGETIVAATGLDAAAATGGRLSLGAFLDGAEARAARSFAVEDARKEVTGAAAEALREAGIAALIGAPLLDGGGRRIGVLAVADSRPRRWQPEEAGLLQQLATVAASALNRIEAMGRDPEAGLPAAWLRRSFDDALAGHAVATADGRILACNAEFARIAGFDSVEAALAANLRSLEAQPGGFAALVDRLQEAPLIPLEELRFVRRDGTPSRVLAKLAATLDEAGRVGEIRAYLLDITQRFLAEEKLRASDERLHLVELATHDVLWEWDLASGRMSWNGAVARRFRYTPEEVRPSIDWYEDRIHPADRERVIRGLERAILGVDSSWSDEYGFRRGDGTYAAVLDRAHVVRNGRNEPERVVGCMIDITERKEAEDMQRFLARAGDALDETLEVDVTAANLARLAVPALADFCLVDLLRPDGGTRRAAVAHVEPERARLLGAGAVLTAGAGPAPTPLAVARDGIAEFEGACGDGPADSPELSRRLCVAPETAPRGYVCVPIAARGRVLGAATFGLSAPRRCFGPLDLMMARELARRAGLALANSSTYETAQRAVLARNEVLGVVSHDLRVPLTTMVATLSLLDDTTPDRREDVRQWHEMLRRATDQMKALIDDLLDASRMESQRFTIERAKESPSALITGACQMLRPLAAAKDIVLEADAARELPPISVDGRQIVRVLGNLVSNAIKFSPAGATIRVHGEMHDAELWISVSDQGEGIAAEQIPRVFDRFWKRQPTDRRGAGLGLAIAEGIVAAHGGRIWVASKEGAGSTFTFALPLRAPAEASPPAEPAPPPATDPTPGNAVAA